MHVVDFVKYLWISVISVNPTIIIFSALAALVNSQGLRKWYIILEIVKAKKMDYRCWGWPLNVARLIWNGNFGHAVTIVPEACECVKFPVHVVE